MTEPYRYIYLITNKLTGKKYGGKHTTYDLNDGYMGSSKQLKRDIEKQGLENFEKQIVKFCNTDEELNQAERELVNESFVADENTYNLKLGGEGGFDFINLHCKDKVLENQKKGSKQFQENMKDPQFRKKYSDNMKEAMNKPEVKEKQSKGIKKYYEEHGSHWIGRHHKEETKQKIGEASSKHQQGSGNSQFGKVWVYNEELKQSKSIFKEDLQDLLNKGWKKGRKMQFN